MSVKTKFFSLLLILLIILLLPALVFSNYVDRNGTIWDTDTELIWMKSTACLGKQTWYDADSNAKHVHSGMCGLTDNSIDGDWRLPSTDELRTLTGIWRAGKLNLTDSGWYWSSKTFLNDPEKAITQRLDNPAVIKEIYKWQYENAIFVRAGLYPNLWIDPTTYYFETAVVGATKRQTRVIKNIGLDTLHVYLIDFSNFRDEYMLENDTCSRQDITVSATCSFDIVFKPKSIGQKDTEMYIKSNTFQSPKLIMVKGNAIAPPAAPVGISAKQMRKPKMPKKDKIPPTGKKISPPDIPMKAKQETICAIVSFTPHGYDGGSPIDYYEAIAIPNLPNGGGEIFRKTGIGKQSPIKISDLNPKFTYYFTVRAHSKAGYSAESDKYTPGPEDYVSSCD